MPSMLRRALLTLPFAVCLTSCSAGESSTTAPPLPPPQPPPAISYRAAGLVYARDSSVAYAPQFLPTTGVVSGTQVTFSTTSATTTATGTFDLRASFTLGVDYVPLTVTAPGYAPSWSPWTPPDSSAVIPVGLYPERSVTPRPGFIKSVVVTDGGGNVPGWFAAGALPTTAERIKQQVHANSMSFVSVLKIASYDATTSSFIANPDPEFDFPTVFSTFESSARSRGLSRMLRLIVFSPTLAQNPSSVPYSNTAFWNVVFARVQEFAVQRAQVAQAAGVEYLVLALPLYMWSGGTARLKPLIEAVRRTGYTGQIFAAFHANLSREPLPHRHYAVVDSTFWSLVDGAVVYAGQVVARAPGQTGPLPRAQSRASMRAGIRLLIDELKALPVPVILELSTPSVHGGASVLEDFELGFRSLTRDYQQQADVYQAAAEEIESSPIGPGPGRIIGLQTWSYLWNENLREFEYWGRPEAWDKYSTIRGKPAEAVLRWWFDRW